jgi:hypothetical protein
MNYLPFENTLITITTNATSGVGTTHPSRMPEFSGILEGYVVPAPLVTFVVKVTQVFSKGK